MIFQSSLPAEKEGLVTTLKNRLIVVSGMVSNSQLTELLTTLISFGIAANAMVQNCK